MSRFITLFLASCMMLFATELPTQKAKLHPFNTSVELNAQIIQLSNAKESIASLISGHLERYYVKPAQMIKKSQKIALINSMALSQMSADFIELKKQLEVSKKNYASTKKLYENGMTSMSELNNQKIKTSKIKAKLSTLKSQLSTIGIDANNLKKTISNFVLYAHSDGVVSKLLKPQHSSVSKNEPIVLVVKNQAFYIKSFVPLKYAQKIKLGDKITINYNGKNIKSHITQILPQLDETTQRVIVLSRIDERVENLFINTYLKSTLYLSDAKEYIAVKKSALSFFNNEWVVFVHKEQHHDEDEHEEHAEHEEHKDNEDEKHDEHEEVEYGVKVVQIITQDDEFVAVEGLAKNEEYISEKSYYVKSELLKSSLGGHGH